MAITPKPPGAIAPPNDLPSEAVGTIAVPKTLNSEAVGTVGAPNDLNALAAGQVGAPNTLNSQAVGQIAIPNTLGSEAAGTVAPPNDLTAVGEQALPRTLTPLISLNFAAQAFAQAGAAVNLADISTFTRASTATFINRQLNALGQYEYFVDTAAINELRYEFDSETGESLGALIEGASTNLTTRSQELNSSPWITQQSSVSANTEKAPDGTISADTIIPDVTNSNSHQIHYVPILTDDKDYTFSVFMKSAGYNFAGFFITANDSSQPSVIFDLINGSVSQITGAVTASVESLGDGWYRCSMKFNALSGVASNTLRIRPFIDGNGSPFVGDLTSGVSAWGAQLEEIPFASSYIPTTSAPVARSFDNLTTGVENLPEKNSDYSVHSIIDVVGLYAAGDGTNQHVFSVQGETARVLRAMDNSTGRPRFIHGAPSISYPDILALSQSTTFTMVVDNINMSAFKNGNIIESVAKGNVTGVKVSLNLGQSTSGSQHLFGHIAEFKTYNLALTAQEVALL